MTPALPARSPLTPALTDIQAPVRDRLQLVAEELHRVVAAEFPLIDEVNGHLLLMKGKMFRPTLTLLASAAADRKSTRLNSSH